ncbi:HK97 gp10 family phage protein [Helicovermis profundi]|uniref:HK97 gp10 family phage protein n=1 Tax=Helicovermis profundi TaxID=3065157 RepID=A0AAU9EAC8_9FIRM|nr:hypothetical protein HLPR_11430 [Clostridia bacterium S502]
MSDVEFNVDEIDDALRYMDEIVERLPRKSNRFLKKEAKKLKKQTISRAKSKVGKKTGNYLKGIKDGKPYKYNGGEQSIRVYNNAPHAHLIEYGHEVLDKNGVSHGFKDGAHVFEDTERKFKNEFFKDCEDFVDDLLNDGSL